MGISELVVIVCQKDKQVFSWPALNAPVFIAGTCFNFFSGWDWDPFILWPRCCGRKAVENSSRGDSACGDCDACRMGARGLVLKKTSGVFDNGSDSQLVTEITGFPDTLNLFCDIITEECGVFCFWFTELSIRAEDQSACYLASFYLVHEGHSLPVGKCQQPL